MKEIPASVEYQIKVLKQDPNWETVNNERTADAIRVYEVMGARWDSVAAFVAAGHNEIAVAICWENAVTE